jgi:hypothetical protein
MLPEDLEMKAYEQARRMWPLPRHYILYSLKPHTHEDLPFRWFQLMIENHEPSAVDRILEEVIVHSSHSDYREDLVALVQLLDDAQDPETEDKTLHVLNSKETPKEAVQILETYLKNAKPRSRQDMSANGPWASLDRVYALNRQYLAAARLLDAGKKIGCDASDRGTSGGRSPIPVRAYAERAAARIGIDLIASASHSNDFKTVSSLVMFNSFRIRGVGLRSFISPPRFFTSV